MASDVNKHSKYSSSSKIVSFVCNLFVSFRGNSIQEQAQYDGKDIKFIF